MVSENIFFDLGMIIIIVSILAFLVKLLKQPLILAYVLTGIFITPVFHLVSDVKLIESMSMIGIAFLLFIVGLEMDFKKLKSVAFISTAGGIFQTLLLFLSGFGLFLALGFKNLEAAYIGLFLCFSSTMVVLKLLGDKSELNTLHGRIVIGILLLEDIIAVLSLTIMNTINDFNFNILLIATLKFASIFIIAFVASKFIFPRYFHFAAKYQELLLISSLGVCFLFSILFEYMGFSLAVGAFLAGLTLGNLQYNLDIISKVKSLKDFFSVLFFVSLGMGLSLSVLEEVWIYLLILLLILFVWKPLITFTISVIFRYNQKPAFLSAISLTQMGEFALILGAQGLLLGHISQKVFSLIVFTTLISILITSYSIKYNYIIYKILNKPLQLISNRFKSKHCEYKPKEIIPEVVLVGHNRIGYSIIKSLNKIKRQILLVDYNPEVINYMSQQKYNCLYGDATDEEIMSCMHLSKIKLLISTIPDVNDSIQIIKNLKKENKKAKIIVTASNIDDGLKLYTHGADYVIMPHFLGGEHVANIISNYLHHKLRLDKEKEDHIMHLKERKSLGHEHPKD